MIRSLLFRLFLFVSPLAAIAVAFELPLYLSGEGFSYDEVLDRQETEPALICSRSLLSQQFNVYKSLGMRRFSPRIVVLGTSRVMQFRGIMFSPIGDMMYNAGGMVQGLTDYEDFAERLSDGDLPRPEVLIVGIDPWILKVGPERESWMSRDRFLRDDAFCFVAHLMAFRKTVREDLWPIIWARAWSDGFSPVFHLPTLGIGAASGGTGFRLDGSVSYEYMLADYLLDPVFRDRDKNSPILVRIRDRTEEFSPSRGLDTNKLERLVAALRKIKDQGVEVIAFLPPFAAVATEILDEKPQDYLWWAPYRQGLPRELLSAGVPCLNYGTPHDFGLGDDAMFDVFHPGEVLVSILLENLVELSRNDSLLREIDLVHLRHLRNRPTATALCFECPQVEGRRGILERVSKAHYDHVRRN